MDKKVLDQQSQHWEKSFSSKPEMFGLEPSLPAKKSLEIFKKNNIKSILELGAGLGRDTIYFAQNSIRVHALDYSKSAVENINKKSKKLGLEEFIETKIFDVRETFKFNDNIFDGCYSHMLYCMALTNNDIKNLNKEIHRIIKPNGINIYTVRNIHDGDYKKGTHRGEDLYEMNGFIINYFSEQKIKDNLEGFNNLSTENFEEGNFPRRLYYVVNQKK